MARKKYEFRPDPTWAGIADKLYLTQRQRKNALKWLVYSLLCLTALILQDTLLGRVRIFGGIMALTPAAIILICVMEGAHNGCIFTLLASVFYVLSGTAEGSYCVALLPACSIFAALFRQAYLRRGFFSEWICAGAAVLLYELCLFVVGWYTGLTYGGRIWVFLATAVCTALVLPGMHPLVTRIGKIGGDTWKE